MSNLTISISDKALAFASSKFTFSSKLVDLLVFFAFPHFPSIYFSKFGSSRTAYYYSPFANCGSCQDKLLRSGYSRSARSV